MKRPGFTIVEVIIVIVLIAIVSVVTIIAIGNPLRSINVDTAAHKISADLRFVQSLALSTAKWYGVVFAVDPGNTYTVYETDGTVDTPIKDPSNAAKNFIVNVSTLYDGVIISSVNMAGGSKVEFSPLGTPYNDRNGSALNASGEVVVNHSGSSKTIKIIPQTGKVEF